MNEKQYEKNNVRIKQDFENIMFDLMKVDNQCIREFGSSKVYYMIFDHRTTIKNPIE